MRTGAIAHDSTGRGRQFVALFESLIEWAVFEAALCDFADKYPLCAEAEAMAGDAIDNLGCDKRKELPFYECSNLGPVNNKTDKDAEWCCHIACNRSARWEVWTGNRSDDFTHSCDMHLSQMLDEDKENRVYLLATSKGTEVTE